MMQTHTSKFFVLERREQIYLGLIPEEIVISFCSPSCPSTLNSAAFNKPAGRFYETSAEEIVNKCTAATSPEHQRAKRGSAHHSEARFSLDRFSHLSLRFLMQASHPGSFVFLGWDSTSKGNLSPPRRKCSG